MGADISAEREKRGEVYLEDLSQSTAVPFCPPRSKTHVVPIVNRELRAGMPSLYPGTIDQNMDCVPIL